MNNGFNTNRPKDSVVFMVIGIGLLLLAAAIIGTIYIFESGY